MTTPKKPTFLRRYTDLPSLLHILAGRKLTLLDPKTWDDKNDSAFMEIYKDRKKLKTVLALCFSQAPETYHHWKVFSNGPAGVCIVFEREKICDALKNGGADVRNVTYMTLAKARENPVFVDHMPFIKRNGFKPEAEVRAVYTSNVSSDFAFDISIQLDCIRSISLSPWMHPSLRGSTVKAIRKTNGCSTLKVSRSTLISNEEWKNLGESALD